MKYFTIRAWNRIMSTCWNIRKSFSKCHVKILAAVLHIDLGRNCEFFGAPGLNVCPGSTVIIGDNCCFRSAETANLLGLNHRCMIATLKPQAKLQIGNGCGFSGTTLSCAKSIKIGNHVRFGANTILTDTDWHADDPRAGKDAGISIGDNVWLGLNAVVLKGVSIGNNSVIGAGSIVTRNIPENVIAAGNPCKVIRNI